jgi:urease accessory protein
MNSATPDIGEVTSKGGLNHCRMHFSVGLNGRRSYLKNAFCTPPFRVVDVTEDKKSPLTYLMTMSSSPGILDRDFHDIRITAEPGVRAVLQNQSYQRLFQMNHGARLNMEMHLAEGSTFSYIQHPLVPHQNSIFRAVNKIFMAAGSELLLGEIITCGRKLSGEVFRFSHLQSLTEIFIGGKIALKDNIVIVPAEIELGGIGQMEGFTHQATLYYINLKSEDCAHAASLVNEILGAEDDLEYGVSKTLNRGLVARVLAYGGEQILDAFRKLKMK